MMIPVLISVFQLPGAHVKACEINWPHWEAYANRFIQHDGRVIEFSQGDRSTSEGQAYSLFHALVANDRKRFDKILAWTRDNLAKGDLKRHLPAWKWGQHKDKSWQVLDENPASDADLWLSYSLLEAGRLWHESRYTKLSLAILQNIKLEEVRYIPDLGLALLPAPKGFVSTDNRWKLNPSYLPVQIFRRFDEVNPEGPWRQLIDSTFKIISSTSRNGVVPDWVIYKTGAGFVEDLDHQSVSSYDAIRVYLWLGTLPDEDPLKSRLLKALALDCDSEAWPPEKTYLKTNKREGEGPVGFKAALLPYLKARNKSQCIGRLSRQIESFWQNNLLNPSPTYYDHNLALFGLGWFEQRYRFYSHGRLLTQWEATCPLSNGATSTPYS